MLHLSETFFLAYKELNVTGREQGLLTVEFYTASCYQYIFALQVKSAAIASA